MRVWTTPLLNSIVEISWKIEIQLKVKRQAAKIIPDKRMHQVRVGVAPENLQTAGHVQIVCHKNALLH